MTAIRMNDEKTVTPVVGVTGNIGAGKSLFCEALVEAGAVVLDADQIGRLILDTNKDVRKQVCVLLGADILLENGEFDRQRIAGKVFANTELLEQFNAIIHPKLLQKIEKNIADLQKNTTYQVIVVDAAVIFEAGFEHICDTIIVIAADDDVRMERMRRSGKFAENDIQCRMAAQIPQAQKIDRADVIVRNNGTPEELNEKACQIYQDIIQHA